MNIVFLLVILTLTNKQVLADTQGNTCAASVSTVPKTSWNSNGVYYQMYDLLVQNTGSCAITSLHVNIAHPSGTTIGSPIYNYDASTGEISGFGGSLAPGQSFGSAGFTLSSQSASVSQSVLTVSVTQQACGNCATSAPAQPTYVTTTGASPTLTPATKAPTLAPATKAPTAVPATQAPTKTPTNVPTTAPTTAPTRGPTVSPTAVPTISPADDCYDRCTAGEICVDMNNFYGPQCFPRSCQSIYCDAGEVCIGDGGVARCIVTDPSQAPSTPSPTPFPASDNCNGMCTQGEACVVLNQTEGYQCYLQSCAGVSCDEGYRCMSNGGVAQCIHTGSGRRVNPVKRSIETIVDAPASVPSAPQHSIPVSVCAVSVSVVPRARSAHIQENGLVAQIWDLIIANENSATPNKIELDISVPSGSLVSQTWNLVRMGSSSKYSVTTHNVLAHNSQFFSAGFVVSGSATPSVSVSEVRCRN